MNVFIVSAQMRIRIYITVIILISFTFAYFYYPKINDYLGLQVKPVFNNSNTVKNEMIRGATDSGVISYRLEVVARELFVPWSIVFTSGNRILVTERNGSIRAITGGKLTPEPLIRFSEVSQKSEEGLMGMAKDPGYDANGNLYVCMAYVKSEKMVAKVVRLKDSGSGIAVDKVILDGIPAAQFHAGCRVRFGPDGKLYVSTGDATDRSLPQNYNSLGGKILRLNTDGTVPTDNPVSGSFIYSLGHRNPQGFDWHPVSGAMVATEHGPSVFDGPAGGDEVNLITRGANYGWPEVSHDKNKPAFTAPLLVFTPAEAPGSGMFYTGSLFPGLMNNYLFGALRGEGIVRIIFTDNTASKVKSFEKWSLGVGRIRDVVNGPDGAIYFTTSNHDGRGNKFDGDDKLYRIIPR